MTMHINTSRLETNIKKFGTIGSIEGTLRGVSAVELTPDEILARVELIKKMEQLELTVQVDPIGNIFGIRPNREGKIDGSYILCGSHIDTVPAGGIFDGRLGVFGALESFEKMNEADIETDFPLVCAAFTGEEGARYPAMTGSRYYLGLSGDEALDAKSHVIGDKGGTLGDELEQFFNALKVAHENGELVSDYSERARMDISEVRAVVELHIEQGPVLDEAKVTAAPVKGVLGISQRKIRMRASDPNNLSKTAFGIVEKLREIADLEGGEQRSTVGVLKEIDHSPLPKYSSGHFVQYTIGGESAHAGGGVMSKRSDAALAAAVIARHGEIGVERFTAHGKVIVGEIEIGRDTPGSSKLSGTINVVPKGAKLTLGILDCSESELGEIKAYLDECIAALQDEKGSSKNLHGDEVLGEGVVIAVDDDNYPPMNFIPSHIELTIDQRNFDDDIIERVDNTIDSYLEDLTNGGVTTLSDRLQRIAPCHFDPQLISFISASLRARGLPNDISVVLGAGHDSCNATYVTVKNEQGEAQRIPTVMIAAPCVGGLSHNVSEDVTTEAIGDSVDILFDTLSLLGNSEIKLDEWSDPPPKVHDQQLTKKFLARTTK